LIAEGRYQDAIEVIRETVPLPYTLGCVCPHPCEDACRRGEVNEAISIRALKKFVAERDTGRWREKLKILPDTGKQVASCRRWSGRVDLGLVYQKAGSCRHSA